MKKKTILALFLLMLSMSLVGCSKKNGVEVKEGTINCNGTAVGITEHRGDGATRNLGEDGTIEYYLCDTMNECMHNTAGVKKENMTAFKKSKYYTLYLQTYIYMYVPHNGGYIEANAILKEGTSLSTAQVVEMMYSDATKLVLKENLSTVTFEDKIVLDVTNWDFKARADEIVIPGLVRVRLDDGSVTATSNVMIQEVSVGKASTEKYEYYQYEGCLIQAAIGTDISSIITFR